MSSASTRRASISSNASDNVATFAANDVKPGVDPLIVGLRARSRRAAADMYRRFAPSMRALAQKRVPQADVDDVVQDAMLVALTSPETAVPNDVAALEEWLHALVRRVALSRRPRGAREIVVDAVACLEDGRIDDDLPLHASDRVDTEVPQ